jgi:hypothetical protein
MTLEESHANKLVSACLFITAHLFILNCSSQLMRGTYKVGSVGICRGFDMHRGFLP